MYELSSCVNTLSLRCKFEKNNKDLLTKYDANCFINCDYTDMFVWANHIFI